MNKNSLLNIDLQPVADVANNLIDKVSNVVGRIATPRGSKLNKIEAENYLKEQIKNDEKMPMEIKAVAISHVNKLIKEYENQSDILNIALSYLNENSNIENIDDDWLWYFFEKAKCISRDDMKVIWGKILASQLSNPSCSKALINALMLIDADSAKVFSELARFTFVNKEDSRRIYSCIFEKDALQFYHRVGIRRFRIKKLEILGLVEANWDNEFTFPQKRMNLLYGNHNVTIIGKTHEQYGNVRITEDGRVLFHAIAQDVDEDYLYICKKIWEQRKVKVIIDE